MALTKVQILLIRACKAQEPIKRMRSIHRRFFVSLDDYTVPYYIMLQLLADAFKDAGIHISGYELTKQLLAQNPDLHIDNLLAASLDAHITHVRFMNKYSLPAPVYPKLRGD